MKYVMEDLIDTVNRLNNQLDERIQYEHELLSIIDKQEQAISMLKDKRYEE